ncbi:hypothetical protein ACQ4PT_034766 [Festuca glaucescens]
MKGAAWRGHGGVAAAVADHLGVSGGAGLGPGARRARLCIYGVALAFALFAAFLAFAPSLPAPSPSSTSTAWFDGFLASASPYRAKAGAGVRGDISASGNATTSAPPNDHVGGGRGARSNSTGITGADAKAGVTIGGLAQNGTMATAGAPIRIINGSGANASSAEAPTGNGIAVLSNNTAVPYINQTGSAVSAAMHGNGDAPPRRGDPSKKRTAQDSAAGSNQKQSTSRAAAAPAAGGSSNSTRNPQKETTAISSQRSAGNSSAVPVMRNVRPAKGAAIAGGGQNMEYSIEEMGRCDMFYGNWVRDDSYPLYSAGSCPNLDDSFNCFLNGRPDKDYQRLRWQPSGCSIPRLNPTDMLERLRGKRLVFVGDSLNRNMWESLVCILRNSIKDKRKVFEVSGNHKFRAEGSYSFLFQDYNCTVEFFRSPFLVQEWEVPLKHGKSKETLRLDKIDRSSSRYKNADIIVFNTGHWWTHEKTSLGKDYYQEGDQVYSELNVHDAYRRALNTWAKWVDSNVNPKKTTVFFRGYSASHFSGGQWNSGGSCDKETEPITNEQYLIPYPQKMSILEEVLHGMKTPVAYLNITRMTDYRKEGHPSIYRKQKLSEEERKAPELYQDCSHWCLPGVPDSWNEVLYAKILVKQHQMLHQ